MADQSPQPTRLDTAVHVAMESLEAAVRTPGAAAQAEARRDVQRATAMSDAGAGRDASPSQKATPSVAPAEVVSAVEAAGWAALAGITDAAARATAQQRIGYADGLHTAGNGRALGPAGAPAAGAKLSAGKKKTP